MVSLRQSPPEGATFQPSLPLEPSSSGFWVDSPVRRGFCNVPSSRKPHDALNTFMLDEIPLVGDYEIPLLQPCTAIPPSVIAFSEAMCKSVLAPESWVHFFEDDSKFERIWRQPTNYLERLRNFAGVIMPDFSTYENMAQFQQIVNCSRNFQLAAWLQHEGIQVIGNSRWNGPGTESWSTIGLPLHSSICLSAHGMQHDNWSIGRLRAEVHYLCVEKQPQNLLIYGSPRSGVYDEAVEHNVAVYFYRPDTWVRSKYRGAATVLCSDIDRAS